MDRESCWLCLSDWSGQIWEGIVVPFPVYRGTSNRHWVMDIDIDWETSIGCDWLIGQSSQSPSWVGVLALELANVYRIRALPGKVYVRCTFAQIARVTASLVHPAYGVSIHVYIQPPPLPLLSIVHVLLTTTHRVSVYRGVKPVPPPPSPSIHVKQCTLHSYCNCWRRRIYSTWEVFILCVLW